MSEENGKSVSLQASEQKGRYIEELVPTYMWHSVLALLLGILSHYLVGSALAIVGIFFAYRVEKLREQGRLSNALSASKSAKIWMLVSLAFTLGSLAFRYDT